MFDYEYRISVALGYLNSLVDRSNVEESDLLNLMILIDPDEDDEELIADAINSVTGLFKKELEYVATMMQRNDPNGTYTPEEIARKPLAYIEVLERWKEDCGYEDVPAWIDKCIEYLMLLIV